MPDIQQETFTDRPGDADASDYRAVSVLAIVSLLASLLSLLAFWSPVVWIMPIAGAALGLLTIRRIDRRPTEFVGRGLAVFAVCLSLLALSAAPSRYFLLNYRARADAREQGLRWFAALREGFPELAFQLEKDPAHRQPEATDLVDYYRSEPGATDELGRFVSSPIVKAVLKIGDAARVRYIETIEQREGGHKEWLIAVYGVTYEEEGDLKTFFVQLSLERAMSTPRHVSQWWVRRAILLPGPPEVLRGAG